MSSMSRSGLPPNDPREWLTRAKSNLKHAADTTTGVCLEDLCFDAQQAAEKSIKAVFVGRKEAFPYIYNIEELLKRLVANGAKVPKSIIAADALTDYAVLTRYPGLGKPVTKREYDRAVRLATAVLAWAERQIVGPK